MGNYKKKSGKHEVLVPISSDLLNEKGKLKEEYLPGYSIGRNSSNISFNGVLEDLDNHITKNSVHFTKNEMMNFISETVLDEDFYPVFSNGERVIIDLADSEVL